MKKALRFILLVIVAPLAIYTGVVLINESQLRDLYNERVVAIPNTALDYIKRGMTLEEGVNWAIDERNKAKVDVRQMGNPINKRLAELRNLDKYHNAVGPDYAYLMATVQKEGDSIEDAHHKIIQNSGRTNKAVNSNAYSMEQWGFILCALSLMIAMGYLFASPNLTYGAVLEISRLGAALIGGRIGVWLGVWLAKTAVWDMQTIQAGVVGGIVGAISLSLIATTLIKFRYNHTSKLDEEELVGKTMVAA